LFPEEEVCVSIKWDVALRSAKGAPLTRAWGAAPGIDAILKILSAESATHSVRFFETRFQRSLVV
jgi:hypothetical protein